MTDDIHSCSYYCTRPACVLRQRDELRAKYVKLLDEHSRIGTSDSDMGEYALTKVRNFQQRLAQAIEDMPFGDTAQSFAQFVREFK